MTDGSGWALAPHACRHCLGRIIERDGTFRCSGCGVEAQGKPHAICGCGLKAGGRKQSFRCGTNPNRSPASPAEIVILFGGVPAVPLGD